MIVGQRMTAAEFSRLPDRKMYELIGGRIADRPSGALAGYTAGQLVYRLAAYTKASAPGFAIFSGLGCCCFPGRPDHVRWAGGAGIWSHRVAADDWHAEFCPVSPDLVVKPLF